MHNSLQTNTVHHSFIGIFMKVTLNMLTTYTSWTAYVMYTPITILVIIGSSTTQIEVLYSTPKIMESKFYVPGIHVLTTELSSTINTMELL